MLWIHHRLPYSSIRMCILFVMWGRDRSYNVELKPRGRINAIIYSSCGMSTQTCERCVSRIIMSDRCERSVVLFNWKLWLKPKDWKLPEKRIKKIFSWWKKKRSYDLASVFLKNRSRTFTIWQTRRTSRAKFNTYLSLLLYIRVTM